MHFDVFNGDADGIISLVQLRLAQPKQSTLISGVKRDIQLLKQVNVSKAKSVTVLDISLEKNIDALNNLLEKNISVEYVDHHRSGNIPKSEHLSANINTDANTCTALLVNQQLSGKYAHWAVTAAYGDNMTASADKLANDLGLSDTQREGLKALGIYINYNGYGRNVDDLHFDPKALFKALVCIEQPLVLLEDKKSIYYQLASAYKADMAKAQSAEVLFENDNICVVKLDDAAWARRVSGVFGNDLANKAPEKAHGVLTHNEDGSFTVSVRAPLNNKQGADEVCVQFATGGGRAGAAGINALDAEKVSTFIQSLNNYYSGA